MIKKAKILKNKKSIAKPDISSAKTISNLVDNNVFFEHKSGHKQNLKKRVLLIITGSIAAYKAMDLIRLFSKNSCDTTCILTKSACEFITPLLATCISGNQAHCELFSSNDEASIDHIALSRQHDLIIVAPATADFIAKIANGYADDLASSVVLASNKKVFVAPAMNEKMWINSITQKNLTKLTDSEISIINPSVDNLACGEFGIGKMADIENIWQSIENFFALQNLLKDKKILITGGATIEPIDPVRFIGNHSSGIQALNLAKVFLACGAKVKLVAGEMRGQAGSQIQLHKDSILNVKTAEEMLSAVKQNLAGNDVFVGCAAVADFRVKNFSPQKIKKSQVKTLALKLIPNPDILDFVGHCPQRPKMVIGFAAESENLLPNAQRKMIDKNCDLVVANDIATNQIFGSLTSSAFLLERISQKINMTDLGNLSKESLSKIIAQKIANFLL